MEQHKDQKRVQDVLLPQILERALGTTEEDIRDCTVVNRLLLQGPDPIFLMEACPEYFQWVCRALDITVEAGSEAIETAHWQGPGSLLEGRGLPSDLMFRLNIQSISEAWRREALWLVLASMSDCTEGGYHSESLLSRVRRQAKAIGTFARFSPGVSLRHVLIKAESSMQNFRRATTFTEDPLFGKPMSDQDHGFYVGFKQGHPCVAVQSKALTFYGTMPNTTLEAEGVTVDKPLSPQFGICFSADK